MDDTLNANDSLKKKKLPVKNLPDSLFKVGIPLRKCRLNYTTLMEVKQLTTERINKLANIIYNTNYRKPSQYAHPGYTCYNPRNAFIFYDSTGKIFEYLEICIECKDYRSLTDRISVGTYCNQKYDLLKDLLIEAGITYGTVSE